MLEHFGDITTIQEVLEQAQTGLWVIEMEEGKEPRMYADKAMLGLLGLEKEPEPEVCYRDWYDRIVPEYYPQVEKVNHPSLPAHPNHALYTKYFPNGGASIFTFEIKGGQEEDRRFMDNLKLFSLLANVANVKDFAIHPPPFPTLPGRIAGIGH